MKRNHPILYQVNTRAVLTECSRALHRLASLDDIPDEVLDGWAARGFSWIWLLSVWETGEVARQISRSHPGWRREFEETLADLQEEDIPGSGFAIKNYAVSPTIGGEEALVRLRERLRRRNISLMLDFVPNHMAPDHPWVESHPDFFIQGTEEDLTRSPENFIKVTRAHDTLIFAHGRDPFFPGWPDTLQLNYGHPGLTEAMKAELLSIAGKCDGVRCDMAMLILPDVFLQTWGVTMTDFWPDAIQRVKSAFPGFLFMGEVYWDREWDMMRQGFDYVYDKRLYDRLLQLQPVPVRDHLKADLGYQEKLTRFLENHDEKRVTRVLPWDIHQASALITYLIPGMRFFHEGQLQGWKIKVSPHLGRRPVELTDPAIERFYTLLLEVLKHPILREGTWELLKCNPAWDGNPTHDNIIAFQWTSTTARLLVVVNFAPVPGQCFISLSPGLFNGKNWLLIDLFSENRYDRTGADLYSRGLYIDIPGWGYHAFAFEPSALVKIPVP